MVYTDAQAWLESHELIECKPLKGRWTKETCLEIFKRSQQTTRSAKSQVESAAAKTVPCADCPILAALEK